MGPPPDPEHMAAMLENPNFASTLNEALSNPEVIDQMIRQNPMLRDMGPQVRQMMQDPGFRRMMTDPEALRNISQMQRQFGGGMGGMFGGGAGAGNEAFPAPGVTDTTEGAQRTATPGQQQGTTPQSPPPLNPFAMFGNPAAAGGAGAGAEAANPFAALFGPTGLGAAMGNNAPTSPPATGGAQAPGSPPSQQQPPAANPIASMAQNLARNPALMQQMLATMGGPNANPTDATNSSAAAAGFNPFAALQAMGFGGGAGGGGGGGGGEGFGGLGGLGGGVGGGGGRAQQQQQDDRPPEDRYAEQLRQLNDMGFYEFERNIEALRRTGGSVQGAVEYLLTH